MSQCVSESVSQWVSESVSQWVSESESESVSQSVSQLVTRIANDLGSDKKNAKCARIVVVLKNTALLIQNSFVQSDQCWISSIHVSCFYLIRKESYIPILAIPDKRHTFNTSSWFLTIWQLWNVNIVLYSPPRHPWPSTWNIKVFNTSIVVIVMLLLV